MEVIKSKENNLVKEFKKLNEIKNIKIENKIVLDNIKVINEAIENNIPIETLLIDEKFINNNYENLQNTKIKKISSDISRYISDVKNPQGLFAKISIYDIEKAKKNTNDDVVIILDNIQDPGNLGTIVRTMDSCNYSNLFLSLNSCYQYNPKVVRSTMGSIFRVNTIRCDIKEKIDDLKNNGYKIIGTSPNTNKILYDENLKGKIAIVIGNEAKGISDDILNKCDNILKIPMLGKAESLNAGIATSIIMYEIVRQNLK